DEGPDLSGPSSLVTVLRQLVLRALADVDLDLEALVALRARLGLRLDHVLLVDRRREPLLDLADLAVVVPDLLLCFLQVQALELPELALGRCGERDLRPVVVRLGAVTRAVDAFRSGRDLPLAVNGNGQVARRRDLEPEDAAPVGGSVQPALAGHLPEAVDRSR